MRVLTPSNSTGRRRLLAWGLVLLGLGLGYAKVHESDHPRIGNGKRAEAVRSLGNRQPPLLLIVAEEDINLSFVELPEMKRVCFGFVAIARAADAELVMPTVIAQLRSHLSAGGCVLMPKPSHDLLVAAVASKTSGGATVFSRTLLQNFRLERPPGEFFVGLKLTPR